MNANSIKSQFELVRKSVERANMPFEFNMIHVETLKVTVWEILKAIEQLKNIAAEIIADNPILVDQPPSLKS